MLQTFRPYLLIGTVHCAAPELSAEIKWKESSDRHQSSNPQRQEVMPRMTSAVILSTTVTSKGSVFGQFYMRTGFRQILLSVVVLG